MFNKEELKKKMTDREVSAQKLAEILNTTKESIYKWRDGTVPRSAKMVKKIESWIKGEQIEPPKKVPATNGVDWKSKYYDLLEKYTALLEITK